MIKWDLDQKSMRYFCLNLEEISVKNNKKIIGGIRMLEIGNVLKKFPAIGKNHRSCEKKSWRRKMLRNDVEKIAHDENNYRKLWKTILVSENNFNYCEKNPRVPKSVEKSLMSRKLQKVVKDNNTWGREKIHWLRKCLKTTWKKWLISKKITESCKKKKSLRRKNIHCFGKLIINVIKEP